MAEPAAIASIARPRRIWAVASIHAEAARLRKLHRLIAAQFEIGDRVVYLGNVIGRGSAVHETLAELLAFRRAIIAGPRMFASDVVVLRGSQEVMWHKLLQLQFAAAPSEVLGWMLDHGVAATIRAYGGDPDSGVRAMREGTLGLARWTAGLRAAMNAAPGHTVFMSALKRAAATREPGRKGRLLFVHAGIDVTRPLAAQGDRLWWAARGFKAISSPYGEFALIVRGYDPEHPGVEAGPFSLSVDGGCGFGGPLLALALTPDGDVADLLEA